MLAIRRSPPARGCHQTRGSWRGRLSRRGRQPEAPAAQRGCLAAAGVDLASPRPLGPFPPSEGPGRGVLSLREPPPSLGTAAVCHATLAPDTGPVRRHLREIDSWGWGRRSEVSSRSRLCEPRPWRGLPGARPAAQPLPAPRTPTGSAGWGLGGAAVPLAVPGLRLRVPRPAVLPWPLCPGRASLPGSPRIHSWPPSWVLHVSPGLEPGVGGLRPHLVKDAWSPSVAGVCGCGRPHGAFWDFTAQCAVTAPVTLLCHPELSPASTRLRAAPGGGGPGRDGVPGGGRTRGLCTVQLRPRRGGQRRRGHCGAASPRKQPPGAGPPRGGWLGGGRRSPE